MHADLIGLSAEADRPTTRFIFLQGPRKSNCCMQLTAKPHRLKLKVRRRSTYQLQGGQVLFPPEVLLKAIAKSGQQVVGVHDDVYEGVQHCAKVCWEKKLERKSAERLLKFIRSMFDDLRMLCLSDTDCSHYRFSIKVSQFTLQDTVCEFGAPCQCNSPLTNH